MKRTTTALLIVVAAIGVISSLAPQARPVFVPLHAQPAQRKIPRFQVDPTWPKLPSKWVVGLVSGVAVDSQDHIWVIHRPETIPKDQMDKAAPPVVEFDIAGNFIQGWGGPGPGYEWPATEHGISVDHKGNVWIAGSSRDDGQILKFTKTGTFVMQIGHAKASKGNTDTENVHGAADAVVYPKTNELFVADGYFNRRIIVFDAETGKFKRMFGAFGNVPTDPPPNPNARGRGGAMPPPDDSTDGPGADQFNLVHSARISSDGILYVSDRANRRVQVFTPDGKYVTQVFLSRQKPALSTLPGMALGKKISDLADSLANARMSASRTAFSPDKAQQYLYVIDRIRQQIAILDRKSLEILGYFGDGPGEKPGSFYILHDIAADSKGNVYTAEVNDNGNRRAQKFTYKGTSAGSTH